jgi:hypothetical protein
MRISFIKQPIPIVMCSSSVTSSSKLHGLCESALQRTQVIRLLSQDAQLLAIADQYDVFNKIRLAIAQEMITFQQHAPDKADFMKTIFSKIDIAFRSRDWIELEDLFHSLEQIFESS